MPRFSLFIQWRAACLAAPLGLLLAQPASAQNRLKTPLHAPSAPVGKPAGAWAPPRSTEALVRPATGPLAAPSYKLANLPTPNSPAGDLPTYAVQATRDAATGLPVFLEAQPLAGALRPASGTPLTQVALAFLDDLKDVLAVRQPTQEFQAVGAPTLDDLGQAHVRLRQVWAGLPVYGSEVIVHFAAGQPQPSCLSGRYFRSPAVGFNVNPAVAEEAARRTSDAALRGRTHVRPLSASEARMLHYTGPTTELLVYHAAAGAAPVLAWHVTTHPNLLERWETFVDAHSGQVLRQYESSCTTTGPLANGPRTATAPDLNGVTQTLNTYLIGPTFYMLDAVRPMYNPGASMLPDEPVGGILTATANNTAAGNFSLSHVTSTTNNWTGTGQAAAVSAHYNAGQAYNYYQSTHNRNSIDGQGGTMFSLVHVADDNGGGLDNAYWNGQFIAYGDGASEFKPLAGGLDVAGHEMTHGVVQNTANLEYQGQSGALNEHMADVFGAMIDRNDWQMGEDIVKPGVFAGGALRSLSDPHNGGSSLNDNGWQPRTMAELYTGSQDNGGVHINSGIPNWAFYKFATAVSKDHGEKIWYRALGTYLTRSSEFIDLRLATIRAATDLYGGSSADVTALQQAFDQVGITGSAPSPGPTVLQVNPGPDLLLTYDTDPTSAGTHYLSSTTGTNFQLLSTTPSRTKPSVTDNGAVAVYVDGQHQLRALTLGANPTESVLSNQPIWRNVAVSKDGNKLAAVLVDLDTSIYVVNLATNPIQAHRYQLYIPTTGGIQSSGVMGADALEWDYTGQYVIYDAYNVVQNSSGQDIDFWNINFLRGWDNSTNSWGDGRIETLIGTLPEGISIGNPVLSKNSPNVLAFDRYDANATSLPFSVLAIDVENGLTGVIFNGSNVPGSPTYSKLDNAIAFTALSTQGDTLVAARAVAADKVTPVGSAAGIVSDAKWANWISQGSRVLPMGVARAERDLPGLSAYPNPATDALTLETATAVTATLYDLVGRPVRTARLTAGSRQHVSLVGLATGTYVLRATDGSRAATRRISVVR